MSKSFTDWMNEARRVEAVGFALSKRLLMSDGTSMSIQASSSHYCSPRETLDSYGLYHTFEVGFPSKRIPAFMEYIDGPDDCDPTNTVYGGVPKQIIEDAINKCGGVIGYDQK